MRKDLPYMILPEIEYNKRELLNAIDNDGTEWFQFNSDGNTVEGCPSIPNPDNEIFHLKDASILGREEVREFLGRLCSSFKVPFLRYRAYELKEGRTLFMHEDSGRQSVMMIPLTDDFRPVSVIMPDGEEIVIQYNRPYIFDTTLRHGIKVGGARRVALHLSFAQSFEELRDLHAKGEFIDLEAFYG